MMKKIFSNLFVGDQERKSIICFDVIDLIFGYLYNESYNVEFKMKGIQDGISVNLYSIPYSLDYEKGIAEIKQAGFNNSYEVLNELYKKMNIGALSLENIEQRSQYYFMHIQFYSEPAPEVKKYFKQLINNFIIFFCCTNSLEANDFKILYTNSHCLNYTNSLLNAELLDINNPKNETQQIAIKDFKLVLQGTCQYLNIEIPENIELPSQGNLIVANNEVVLENFEEFIRLISRGDIEEKELKKWSKKLFKNYKSGSNEYPVILDETYFDFFRSLNTWYSDWKFDPEDAESSISEMIDKKLNFKYPKKTYSDGLFPYIQKALNKLGYELMSFNIYGDGYLFFVANKKDVSRILKLSELTKIEVDQL
jgi:hypothetical protein